MQYCYIVKGVSLVTYESINVPYAKKRADRPGPLPFTVQMYSLRVYISHTAWTLICAQTNIQLPKCDKSFAKGHLSYYIFMVSRSVCEAVKLDIRDFNKSAEKSKFV